MKDSLKGLTSDISNTPMVALSASVDTATLPRSTATGYGYRIRLRQRQRRHHRHRQRHRGPRRCHGDLAAAIALVLWPAAQAALVISDLKTNGPTRMAKGLAWNEGLISDWWPIG